MRDEPIDREFSAAARILHPRIDLKSAFRNPKSAFTLTEMFTTVAILVIVMGLMVSLARDVRTRSAQELSRDLLGRLDAAMRSYHQRTGQLPAVLALAESVSESDVQRHAAASNLQVVRALRSSIDLTAALGEPPVFIFDQRTVRDSWGSPVLFLPTHHPAIGLGVGDRPFFVSAGPDRQFLTRDDNLYSYEMAGSGATTDEHR